jgi:hypothetical protein
MVEIEIGVLRTQCLDRRIDNRELLISEVAAREHQRNKSRALIKWMFTPKKPAPKWPAPTQSQTTSHNPCAEVLGRNFKHPHQIAAQHGFLFGIAQITGIDDEIDRVGPIERHVGAVDDPACAHLGDQVTYSLIRKHH